MTAPRRAQRARPVEAPGHTTLKLGLKPWNLTNRYAKLWRSRRNLALAGDWTDTGLPATIEGAIRSGRAAAEVVLSHLS